MRHFTRYTDFTMQFDIVTIFPDMFSSYFSDSILKRAQDMRIIDIRVHDLRQWTADVHRTVDDAPYGGGAGMVMKVEPLYQALSDLHALKGMQSNGKTVLFSAGGKRFTQEKVRHYSALDRLVMVCGRYEGVDQRVADYCVDEVVSVGPYVLTGGELPAMIVTDAVTRLLPGVLGNEMSSQDESFSVEDITEYPHYTRPESFHDWNVPDVLLSGDHGAIARWRDARKGAAG